MKLKWEKNVDGYIAKVGDVEFYIDPEMRGDFCDEPMKRTGRYILRKRNAADRSVIGQRMGTGPLTFVKRLAESAGA